jgi:thioredoxin 1
MSTHKVTDSGFETEVLQSPVPVLVDFWAAWCGPCKMMNPVIEQVKSKNENLEVVKVNVDEERDLAVKYQIRSIPTLVLFKEGVPVWRNSGVLTEQTISDKIKEVL